MLWIWLANYFQHHHQPREVPLETHRLLEVCAAWRSALPTRKGYFLSRLAWLKLRVLPDECRVLVSGPGASVSWAQSTGVLLVEGASHGALHPGLRASRGGAWAGFKQSVNLDGKNLHMYSLSPWTENSYTHWLWVQAISRSSIGPTCDFVPIEITGISVSHYSYLKYHLYSSLTQNDELIRLTTKYVYLIYLLWSMYTNLLQI